MEFVFFKRFIWGGLGAFGDFLGVLRGFYEGFMRVLRGFYGGFMAV